MSVVGIIGKIKHNKEVKSHGISYFVSQISLYKALLHISYDDASLASNSLPMV